MRTRRGKRIRLIILSVILCLGITGPTLAENIIFTSADNQVTGLDLKLELFDLKVTYLNILRNPSLSSSFQYIVSVNSHAFEKKRIQSWVNVNQSILNGSLEERKDRIDKLCNDLFKVYQDWFIMMDIDHKKIPGEGIPGLRMKPCNLKILVQTTGIPWKSLAEWECGRMSYKEGFLKN
jgi:hypothetical protein